MLKVRVEGLDKLKEDLKDWGKSLGDVLEAAVIAGGRVIANEASDRSPYITGTNASSIVNPPVKDIQRTATSCSGKVGPTTPYGRRLEFGFVGEDSLGRNYHQAAQPYMRPACAAKGDEAKQEMADTIREVLNR